MLLLAGQNMNLLVAKQSTAPSGEGAIGVQCLWRYEVAPRGGGEGLPGVGVHPHQVCYCSETTPHTHGIQQIHPACCNQLLLRRHSLLQPHSILTGGNSTAAGLLLLFSTIAPLCLATTATLYNSAVAVTSLCRKKYVACVMVAAAAAADSVCVEDFATGLGT